jgi:hypothetical protein
LSDLYLASGLIVIAINLLAAAVGGLAWHRHLVSMPFWYLLRIAQVATLGFVFLECVLYAQGHRSEDGLHYLYVFLPVVASLFAEAVRGAAASQELGEVEFRSLPEDRQQEVALAIVRRETGVMTTALLVAGFLVWRAVETTTGMF